MQLCARVPNPDLIKNGQAGSIKSSVADLGSIFFTPGSGIGKKSEIRDKQNIAQFFVVEKSALNYE